MQAALFLIEGGNDISDQQPKRAQELREIPRGTKTVGQRFSFSSDDLDLSKRFPESCAVFPEQHGLIGEPCSDLYPVEREHQANVEGDIGRILRGDQAECGKENG